jgi:hypothetical protein
LKFAMNLAEGQEHRSLGHRPVVYTQVD